MKTIVYANPKQAPAPDIEAEVALRYCRTCQDQTPHAVDRLWNGVEVQTCLYCKLQRQVTGGAVCK